MLNEYFDIFTDSVELTGLLGIADNTDIALCDDKIRRSFADTTEIKPEELPFMEFGFIPSHSDTDNHKVNREIVEFNIYAPNIYKASQIFKAIKKVLNEKYKDAQVFSPGQQDVPIVGMYCFSFRIKTMVGS